MLLQVPIEGSVKIGGSVVVIHKGHSSSLHIESCALSDKFETFLACPQLQQLGVGRCLLSAVCCLAPVWRAAWETLLVASNR